MECLEMLPLEESSCLKISKLYLKLKYIPKIIYKIQLFKSKYLKVIL